MPFYIYSITGAVEVTIPDVMEMQLIPKGVDVDLIREEIRSAVEEIQKGFKQYSVSDIEELRKKQEEYEKAYREYEKVCDRLRIVLNGESWEVT